MDWMFESPQNSYFEILIPNVMVLGGGAFQRWLGYEGGAHMSGISVLIKETPECFLALSSPYKDTRSATWMTGSHQNPTMLAP